MKKTFVTGAHRMLIVLRDTVAFLPQDSAEKTLEDLLHRFESYVEGGWRKDPEFSK